MNKAVSKFNIPLASMTVLDIVGKSVFIMAYDKIIIHLFTKAIKSKPKLPTPLQRIGVGLAVAMLAIIITSILN